MSEGQPPNQPLSPSAGGYTTSYSSPPDYYLPPKKRKAWLWVLIGFVVLFFGGCLVVGGVIGSPIYTTHKQQSEARPGPGEMIPGIGQEVRDGKFGFTVRNVSRAPQSGARQAHGEFVIVTMTVKNVGDEPWSYFANDQKLIDTAGRQFGVDAMAITEDPMVPDLNPGSELNVTLPFDVLLGTVPAMLEVHDSMLSDGAKIKLY